MEKKQRKQKEVIYLFICNIFIIIIILGRIGMSLAQEKFDPNINEAIEEVYVDEDDELEEKKEQNVKKKEAEGILHKNKSKRKI